MLMQGFGTFLWLLNLAILFIAVIAFVIALMSREDAFRAADKQTKPFWLVLLGVTVAVNVFVPMLFLQIIGLVASIVFMVDVRPALQRVSGGGGKGRWGRRRGGSSSDGPYGPYNGGR
ncbi:DUF2516 family protein [Streptomyces sp. LP05-1]|uniref:DUF2516 family protein n=1 Tax=Streptomyces pyxinae TaxID=2970734 RepID=A0ABT2CMW9_9ACTN|nr:DUF2516 family protein [Streptomyces sp. LP05-1]MCS0638778.1 DUF2516 family protein [Streptomyces sp. LP05-1]